jgi:hypothetical protein
MKNKFNAARKSLIAPHPDGEARSFYYAFQNCSLAFNHFDANRVKDEEAGKWIKTILQLMDTTGLQDTPGEGLWQARAKQMSLEEKIEF